jgi:hypothetical protein
MSNEGVVPPPVPGPPVPAPGPPPPPPPPPLTPNVKPITLTVDAHQVIDATLGQLESIAPILLSAAIQELLKLADPMIQKYVDQLLAALPGLIAGAIKHLLLKDPEVNRLLGDTGKE